MTITVSSGVTSSGLNISAGDPLVVLSGGTVEAGAILSGGSATLSSGADGNSLTVSSGGVVVGPGDLIGNSDVYGAVSRVTVVDIPFSDGLEISHLEILSGGTASDVTVFGEDASIVIDAGATASGTQIESGAFEYVSGSATGDTISSGGLLSLGGGAVSDETVLSGGTLQYSADQYGGQFVSSNMTIGEVTSTTASHGVTVSSGGLIDVTGSFTVLSGATLSLGSGASVSVTTVSAGGVVSGPGDLYNGSFFFNTDPTEVYGSVDGVTLGAGDNFEEGSYLEIMSGGAASGVRVYDAVMGVNVGATAAGTVLSWGGFLEVSGSVADTIVGSGGEEDVYKGGVTGDTVRFGGLLLISGGHVSDETVQSGGTLDFEARLTSNVTVNQDGANAVTSTTQIGGVTVSSGGILNLSGVEVLGGATLSLGSGALAAETTVAAGGVVSGPGALVEDTLVYGSVSGVTVSGIQIDPSGDLEILSGGAATDARLINSVEAVLASGTATGTLVSGGGEVVVSAGGAAVATVISSGGVETVDAGGVASASEVTSRGFDYVLGGATVATQVSFRGTEIISAGGVASGTLVSSGGVEFVYRDGVASGTTVLSAGKEFISSGGVASGTTVLSGGAEYVSAAGTTTGTVLSDGGHEAVLSGGVASGTTVLSGGAEYVSAAGTTTGTVLSDGGHEVVLSGAAASATTVLSGGEVAISSDGAAYAAIVSSGGYELVLSGGAAESATVLSGGRDDIYSGGQAFEQTVSSGGRETISSGGDSIGLTLLSGGVAVVDGEARFVGAGTLDGTLTGSGAIVETGGGDLVLSGSGAAFSGKAAIEGGAIELASAGALGTGYVEFAEPTTGSAVLQIDAADAPAAGGTFANVIDDFGGAHEDIDLRSIAFVAGASATVVGSTLVLHDGGKTYTFKIAGTTAGAYPVLSDGHGGTLIDPKVVAFAQTAAAFAPADAAKTALVSSTSPAGQTPFLHATASASAGHL